MPDDLLRLTEVQWTAVQAIAVSASSLILVLTAILAVRQLRQAARSAQFAAVNRMQELVDDFRESRRQLFENLPVELAFTRDQFALRPPKRQRQTHASYGERRRTLLTPEQTAAMASITDGDLETARRVMGRLNDLGQLVEDGFFPEQTFYDKHQVMVLRCCHLVEPIRQQLEDESEGGNYGRRLRRMRLTAARYYDRIPKPDEAAVYVKNSGGRRRIYDARPGPLRRARWAMTRRFRRY